MSARIVSLDTRKPFDQRLHRTGASPLQMMTSTQPPAFGTLWRIYIPETLYMAGVSYIVRHTATEAREDAALMLYNRDRVRYGSQLPHVARLPALSSWFEITDHNAEIHNK